MSAIWIKWQKTLAVVAMGGMPLATVSSCDYGPGGGTFFLDRNVEAAFGLGGPGGFDLLVDDVYYEEDIFVEEDIIVYEDYWEEDYYYYEEDDESFFDEFLDWF